MGITRCVVSSHYVPTFTHAFKIDLRRLLHKRVPHEQCTIPHTRETCDRVAHFLQEYADFFDEADHVLIERQPPVGLKDIEGLIMQAHRAKTTLISPNKMHKFFGISRFSYEERKVRTEHIASPHLEGISTYENNTRRHDMADSACICLFFVDTQRRRNPIRLPFDEYRL